MRPSKSALQFIAGLCWLLIFPTDPVLAQSGVAVVAADATVYEDEPDDNAGADAHYCIGNHATSETRRAFLRFDLPAIPAGSTITRVVYDFTQNRVRRTCTVCEATLIMSRVTESWLEGSGSGPGSGPCSGGDTVPGVNWNNQPPVAGISAMEPLPDTDQVPTPITIDTDIGADDDQLIADIQGWVDGDFQNFGWQMRVSEETTADNARRMTPGSITIHWTVPNGGVMIVKEGVFDPGGNGITDPGDLINYTFTITNTGDVELTNVAVTDPLVSPIACPGGNPIPSLAPAAMEVCTGSYAITQDDIDNGVVNNTADADGQCTAPNCPVNDDDTHMETIPAPPLEFSDGFENRLK